VVPAVLMAALDMVTWPSGESDTKSATEVLGGINRGNWRKAGGEEEANMSAEGRERIAEATREPKPKVDIA
jgi:hypothetical protein